MSKGRLPDRCAWPWRFLAVGSGFGIPRRIAGAYMRNTGFLYHLARRCGIRVSVHKQPEGLTVTRVA